MMIADTRARLNSVRRGVSGLVSVAAMAALLACSGSGAGGGSATNPAAPPAGNVRSNTSTHKVQVGADQLDALSRAGGHPQLIADYGSSKLVSVDDKGLAKLAKVTGAEVRDDLNDILLNVGPIDTQSKSGLALKGIRVASTGKNLALVQYSGPIKTEWHQALEATGVRVVSYIPNNAYLVWGDVKALNALKEHAQSFAAVQWSGDFLIDYKLHPSLQTDLTDTYAIQLVKDETTNPDTLALIRSLQSQKDLTRNTLGYVNVIAFLTREQLNTIAARPDVISILPRLTPRKFDERQDLILAGQITGNLVDPSAPGYLAWLTSKGFTQASFTASGFGVDVSDSGMDNGTQVPNHFGLYTGGNVANASRVVYNRVEGTPNSGSTLQGCDGHGNLNTHIVAGYSDKTGTQFVDGAGYKTGLGMAPFVKVGSSVVFDPGSFTSPNYTDLQSRAFRDGMRISTNSWGSSSSAYTIDAQEYDSLVRDAQPASAAVPNAGNQEMTIVFAAGNQGSALGSIGSPATAKNVISVGASENVRPFGSADGCGVDDTGADSLYDVAFFSSRGPTADGRIKPDIMAPGTHITGGVAQKDTQRANPPANPNGDAISCYAGTGVCGGTNTSTFFPEGQQWYTASSGTSHSTPAIAGAAALVRQYFLNTSRPAPSPAMTKAYLMSSTRYMNGAGGNDDLYSNNQGTGLLDLGMAFDGTSRFLDDQNPVNLFTSTGQTRTVSGVVADTTKPLRITVAWTDAPGSTAGAAFDNNLDLSVDFGGNTYKGNHFTKGDSTPGGVADTANNVESVFLPAGSEGAYTVTVSAGNITSDGVPGNASALDQDYALVVYNSCTSAPAAPTGLAAATAGNNKVNLTWTGTAPSYNVYRGTTSGGPYTRLATSSTATYSDTTVSGGSTYYYVVRAVNCAESVKSNQASVVAVGSCTLPPVFAGLVSASNGATATCGISLGWAAATPACSGTLGYSVYRSTSPGFTPGTGNRIKTGATGAGFVDTLNLVNGQAYYYVVHAVETGGATTEEHNTVQKSALVTGTASGGVTYFDDLDAQRPASAAAYWIATTDLGTAGTLNLTSACRFESSSHSYRFGAASAACGGTYPVSTQATLSLGGNGTVSGINGFAIPSSALNPTLTFNHWYSLESKFDGAYLAYSIVGASGPWMAISDVSGNPSAPFISAGGYDGTIFGGAGQRYWSGANTGANLSLAGVTVDLAGVKGKTVWFAWRFVADSSFNQEGYYVDDVHLNALSFNSCTTSTPPPGPVASFVVTGLPASVGAGAANTFTVTAQDAVGVTVTGYSGTVHLTSTDGLAMLPADSTLTNGTKQFSATLKTLGTETVTATDTANATVNGSASTTVTAGQATMLVFNQNPSNAIAGASLSPSVTVGLQDAFGNPVSTGTASVTIALGNNPGGATLNGTKVVAMVAGVASFTDLNIQQAGTGYTLIATAASLASATSTGFNIAAAPANKLAVLVQPSNTLAGANISPAIQIAVLDAYGNATAGAQTVKLAIGANPGGSTLAGTTSVAAVQGVATFASVSLNKSGASYTLKVTSSGLTGVTTNAFNITNAAPAQLVFSVQPSNTGAAVAISPAVNVTQLDAFGNVAVNSTKAVTLSIGVNPAGGTLSGTTNVAAVAGVATFSDASINKKGAGYTLQASASGLLTGQSTGFDVLQGAPTKLVFATSPTASVVSAAAFSATVDVTDSGGNLVVGGTAHVVLSLSGGAPGATLGGTLEADTVAGVATFSNLSVGKAGTGYVLNSTATSLAGAVSPDFNVVAGEAAKLSFLVQPAAGTTTAPLAPAIQVGALDAQGNPATTAVTLALGNANGATLGGTVTVTAASGVASFADLTVDMAGTGYTLSASAAGLPSMTSNTFDITKGVVAKPTATITAPANNGKVTAGKITVSAKGSVAAGLTVASLTLSVDGTQVATSPSATVSGTWDATGATAGSTHIITSTIKDSEGTTASATPVKVTVQGTTSGCGCGSTTGGNFSLYLGALGLLQMFAMNRRRKV